MLKGMLNPKQLYLSGELSGRRRAHVRFKSAMSHLGLLTRIIHGRT